MNKDLIELLKNILEISDREILLTDKFREYPEWDSLAYLSLISMIDEEFDVVIEGNDFKKITTVQELVDEINRRVA